MLAMRITPPWTSLCHLCQFRISHDENTVTVTEDGKVSEISQYETVSSEILRVVCHPECVGIAGQERYKIALATSYAYEPPMGEIKRRVAWLNSDLSSRLVLFKPLPPELHEEIAKLLLREYAVANAARYWTPLPRQSADICVDVSAEVWVRFTEFEGIKYISDLANSPSPGYEVMFVPDLTRRVDCMYVSEDHLGVRQICFSSCEEVPPATPSFGVWWTISQTASIKPKVLGKFDGIKLRDVGWAEPVHELSPVSRCMWEIPLPPTTQISFSTIRKPSHDLFYDLLKPLCISNKARSRMALLRCNELHITGYSVFLDGNIKYIHAHIHGENLSFYDHPPCADGVWLYMPLQHGEFLEDIWIRRHNFLDGTGLVFRTNRGRIMTAGPYLHVGHPTYSWGHVQTLEHAPSRLFFRYSSEGISELGLETSPPILRKNAVGLIPFSPPPNSLSFTCYFFSRASLEDVVEVTPCCMSRADVSAIIGLLFRYADGHQWSVGEVRLDLLQDSIQVNSSEKMTLGFSAPDKYPYVASIHHCRVDRGQSDRSRLMLLDIHWTGYLEWWFNSWQCKVYHNGQASPETRH
ncbi:uncharacterized protein F4807DRAFT_434099 [Annulohypoxylon truncatum]|uniref:uncharacterized protein n=1 Tax=Annulohypoxylon truncatum TaxID=327061 RepID=UPI00200782EE|nr:uncharacterized protein F4807DRAFT_434099 [Annulohypoxylon truncatum]KAI1207666.1 hypothetical protein F4807DRAFT_434099 [Annulohypoxylon truncatum]